MFPAWYKSPDFHNQDYNVAGGHPSLPRASGLWHEPSYIPWLCNFRSTFSCSVRSFGLEPSGNLELHFCFPCLRLLICIALLFIRDEGCCFDSIVFCYPLLYVLSVCNLSLFQFSKWPVCTFSCFNKVSVTCHLCVTHMNRGQFPRCWPVPSQVTVRRERRGAYFFSSVRWCSSCFLFCLFLCYVVPFQEQLCLPLHILEEKGLSQVAVTVQALLELAPPKQQHHLSAAWGPPAPGHWPGQPGAGRDAAASRLLAQSSCVLLRGTVSMIPNRNMLLHFSILGEVISVSMGLF